MPESEPLKPQKDSKLKRKREMDALQKLGESLVKLTNEQLEKINLPENLLDAIQHLKSLTSNEAKRRQLQYIGKIMREVDPEPIQQALNRIKLIHRKNTAEFHQVEEYRSKLIEHGDDALNVFLNDHPKGDRQHLRQLIRNAQQDRKNNKNTGAETALFRYLQSIIEKL